MNKFAKRFLVVLPLLAFLMLITIAAALLNRGNAGIAQATGIQRDYGAVLPFSITDLSNRDLHGHPVLLTFFASWCGPCMVEHPILMRLSRKISIYGIDFMDQPDDLKNFLDNDGNPYKKIGQDLDGTSGVAFGVTGLPTSFIIDARGHIIYRHEGPLTANDIPTVLSLMSKK